MLIFLLFLSINVQGDYYFKLYHSSSLNNSFLLDNGFLNPAMGSGIIGATQNPATLGSAFNIDFYIGLSGPSMGSHTFDGRFGSEEIEDSIFVPFNLQANEIGGVDFIGIAKKIGKVGVGISFGGGSKWRMEAGMDGIISGEFHIEDPFKITHSHISEILPGDTLEVSIPLSGELIVATPKPFKVEYSSFPVFVGAGTRFGPLKVGVGLKMIRYSLFGEGKISVLPGTFSTYIDTTVLAESGTTWYLDNVSGNVFIDDTLFSGEIHSRDISGIQSALNIGCLFDANVMKLSLAYENGKNFDITGGWGWLFSNFSDLPEDIEIDTSGLNVRNDTITGNISININNIPKEINSEENDNLSLQFTGYHTLRAGIGMDFSILRLGVSGAFSFPISGDYSITRLRAGVSFGIPVPVIEVNAGVVASALWLRGDEIEDFFLLPSASAGLSLSYKRNHVRVDLPIRVNLSQLLLNSVESFEEIEEGEFGISFGNIWKNINLGLGVRVTL